MSLFLSWWVQDQGTLLMGTSSSLLAHLFSCVEARLVVGPWHLWVGWAVQGWGLKCEVPRTQLAPSRAAKGRPEADTLLPSFLVRWVEKETRMQAVSWWVGPFWDGIHCAQSPGLRWFQAGQWKLAQNHAYSYLVPWAEKGTRMQAVSGWD